MKKIFKSIFVLFVFILSLSLTSCDFINVLFDQTQNSPEKTKTDDSGSGNKDKDPDPNPNPTPDPDPTPVVNTSRSETDYSTLTIDSFIVDYRNQYSYKEFAKDETYAAEMTEAYKTFYNAALEVLKGNTNYETTTSAEGYVTFDIGKYESTNEQLINTQIVSVVLQVIRENPVFYFLAPSYSVGWTQTGLNPKVWNVSLICDGTYATASARSQMNTKIINYGTGLIENKDVNNKSDYQIVKMINDNLKANLSYAYKTDGHTPEDSPWAHSVVGLYYNNKGVCECYAKNFKLYCDLLKVDSMFVVGTGNGGAHAWNIVEIDGNWYGIDVTWNDNPVENYFLLGQSFNASHLINPNTYGADYQVGIPQLAENNYSAN